LNITHIIKGNAGIKRLNQVLQDILNPKAQDTREIEFGDIKFRKGEDIIIRAIN
jgi:exodeoxyribonuclease V alpha subunit